jgi:hypothetical protein
MCICVGVDKEREREKKEAARPGESLGQRPRPQSLSDCTGFSFGRLGVCHVFPVAVRYRLEKTWGANGTVGDKHAVETNSSRTKRLGCSMEVY